jgi:hypothetical protein
MMPSKKASARKRPRGMPRQWTATRAYSRSSNAPWKRHFAWLDGQIAELSRASHKVRVALAYREKLQYHVTRLPSTLRWSPVVSQNRT